MKYKTDTVFMCSFGAFNIFVGAIKDNDLVSLAGIIAACTALILIRMDKNEHQRSHP